MRWSEHRMELNESADWSRGEITVSPHIIKHFWVPDIGIHDLVRLVIDYVVAHLQVTLSRFTQPVVLQEAAALEIVRDHSMYYKTR